MKLMTRQAMYNPFGKCDELIKAKVPYQIKDQVSRLARANGMNESEFLRMVVMLYLYGQEEVLSIEAQKVLLVASKGHQDFTNSFPSKESE